VRSDFLSKFGFSTAFYNTTSNAFLCLLLLTATNILDPKVLLAQEESAELDIEALRKELKASRVETKDQQVDFPAIDPFSEPEVPTSTTQTKKVISPSKVKAQQEDFFLDGDGVPAGNTVSPKASTRESAPLQEPLIKNENAAYLNDENRTLKNQVSDLKKKFESKSEELEKVRNRLVIAETQVERLSSFIEKRNAQVLQNQNAQMQARASIPMQQNYPANQAQQQQQQQQQQHQDMLVATVVANKANLRTGPGVGNSPLLTVNKGTRLAVETRQVVGDTTWYRVLAPNGSRAWVVGDVLNFESQGNTRVGGYVPQKKQF